MKSCDWKIGVSTDRAMQSQGNGEALHSLESRLTETRPPITYVLGSLGLSFGRPSPGQ